MYYFNFILLYSFIGFTLESFYYKLHNCNMHSSIFTGPYTLVYGFGMFFSYLFFLYLNNILPLNLHTYILYYMAFTIITSIIEYLGGNIIYYFLKIDKWNYSNYKYHFGKYLYLRNSLIWGLLVLITIIFIHPYLNNNILLTIPKNTTIMLIIIFLIDLANLILKIIKLNYNKKRI